MQRAILHDSRPYCVCMYVYVQINRMLTYIQIWCHLSIMRLPHLVWPSNTWGFLEKELFIFKGLFTKATLVQGCEDSEDTLSCRSFSAKEPLIIGLFLQKMTGRAAAMCTAPTLPHVTRVGPNQGGRKLGVYPGIYPLYSRIVVCTIILSDMGWLWLVGSIKR